MDYSQRGVLKTQERIVEVLRRLLAERGVLLDPGGLTWFDGRLNLPTPAEPWKMALSSHGVTASVEFTPAELDAFVLGYPGEVVSGRLRQAVSALQPPRAQPQ